MGENGVINQAQRTSETEQQKQANAQLQINDLETKLATSEDTLTISRSELNTLINQIVDSKVEDKMNNKILDIYPVGSIYISTSSTNPSEFIGGTWESYGQGRTLIGAGTGIDTNSESQTFTANAEGGEYKHTLSVNEMPSHTHVQDAHDHDANFWIQGYPGWQYGTSPRWIYVFNWNDTVFANTGMNSFDGYLAKTPLPPTNLTTATNQNTGGGETHNNIQPYIVTYMWKRVQ